MFIGSTFVAAVDHFIIKEEVWKGKKAKKKKNNSNTDFNIVKYFSNLKNILLI